VLVIFREYRLSEKSAERRAPTRDLLACGPPALIPGECALAALIEAVAERMGMSTGITEPSAPKTRLVTARSS
jgi:hypothetical protein